MNPVIGIIGGMGPLATCDLMQKIIEYTDADTDQEHVRICVDCNTNIPDRTTAILHGGKSPVPELVKSAKRLEAMGAQVLIMSCNTAHYFYDRLAEALAAIPEKERSIILLYWFLELADREIADRMGIARRTVNTHRQNAYRLLKKLMGGDADE